MEYSEESQIKRRTIKLSPIKVKYFENNPIPFSCVVKRRATVREALYIFRNILGFDVDLVISDCGTDEEKTEMRHRLTKALNDFLNGGDWNALCDECCVDRDLGNFAIFVWLISHCQEKGIL